MKKRYLLICCVMVFVCCTLIGCGKKNNNNNESIAVTDDMLTNIKSEYIITKDEKLVVKLTNENSQNVNSVDVNVTLYDENGKLLSSNEEMFSCIDANSDYVFGINLPYDEDGKVAYPGNVKINLSKGDSSTTNFKDKISIKYNKAVTGNVVSECKNNSDKNLFTNVSIVYYKSNNIVAFDSSNDVFTPNESKSIEFNRPINQQGNVIEYDNYKIYYNALEINAEDFEINNDGENSTEELVEPEETVE